VKEVDVQKELDRAFKREGLFFLAIGLATLVLLTLGGCGGGAAALPFGSPDATTEPVNCATAGCAK